MEVRVLKVRGEANLDELHEVISGGHTVVRHGLGAWQMPAPTKVGDLLVWYSGVPHQEFVAYGWVSGPPHKLQVEKVKHYGPVCSCTGLCSGRPLGTRLATPAATQLTNDVAGPA